MITLDQIGWIRRLHRREHKSDRQIVHINGSSRNTVATWLRGDLGKPIYRRVGRPNDERLEGQGRDVS